ncbi:membralin-like [Uloborus diversus]|uniref:membralin-like n=1 Tax=Uloborus diversus TaxID=327109 RepID=UPI00240A84A8|nr:membralin-like [Uloborus diversus]
MSQPGGIRLAPPGEHILLRHPSQEPLARIRDRLFRAAFVRLSLLYARLTTPLQRRVLEFLVLTMALLSILSLVYIHGAFLRGPGQCLADVESSWAREGILRVEVVATSTLEESYDREERLKQLADSEASGETTYSLHSDSFFINGIFDKTSNEEREKDSQELEEEVALVNNSAHTGKVSDPNPSSMTNQSPSEIHIMEFSLEHGFLKLSHRIRKKLGVPVHLVTIDPDDSTCFGSLLDRFFVYYVLGYDDVLLLSLKLLAEKQKHRGFVRNIVTGSEYVFVNVWMDQKSYLTAAFVMFLFTASVSILLRHSHHQIFVFIVWILHMMEFHSTFHFPAAPLMTVILSLVGLEAVLSEFFQDTSAAFYVILIVWAADQYRSVCCTHRISRKHWTKFFFLYHFFFYGYTFRFGHNLHLAFFTSWLFILHSMMYFFHRYELPLLLSHEHSNNSSRNGPPEPPPDTFSENEEGTPRSNQQRENSETPGDRNLSPDSLDPQRIPGPVEVARDVNQNPPQSSQLVHDVERQQMCKFPEKSHTSSRIFLNMPQLDLMGRKSHNILQNNFKSCIVDSKKLFNFQLKYPKGNYYVPLCRMEPFPDVDTVIDDDASKRRNIISKKQRTFLLKCRKTALLFQQHLDSVTLVKNYRVSAGLEIR